MLLLLLFFSFTYDAFVVLYVGSQHIEACSMCYDKSVQSIFHYLLFACLQIISDTSVISRMILMTKLSGDPPNIQSASGELIERCS